MIIFISQPMRGWTQEQITAVKRTAMKKLRMEYGDDTRFQEVLTYESMENPAFFLGAAISQLAHSDAAYFVSGWEEARGCRIEHEVCEAYGIRILED